MPRSRPLVAGLAVAVVATIATAAPASAHDKLISSDPASGQTLAEAPSAVSLTFSADVLDMGAAVVVSDDGGTDWVSAAPMVDGPTVTAALDPGMADTGYEIRWRVVSSDGHPISGVVPFAVGDGKPADAAEGTGSGGDGGGVSVPDTAGAPDAGADARSSTQSSTQTQIAQEGEVPWRVVLVGAGGAAVAVALLALVQFLRRRSDAGGADGPGDDPGSSETV
ncbi:copper resistance CopC family protein [Promicromonospora panici]|uniref:copper resistance CopC family protein n=1 Tax=Promicromonospora panici TaxID=2219658 RepID=UPI0013EA5084|nr:copper resistance CopC family protein [Promicromonospora panici]